ncbi:MAG: sulfonate transport system permease protein [Micromonosporaceae bacterium]|jgi:NitT/TauT family transport system permease protein|nr:sulfonate transport system permease protein [Micromonosporaceae bacterium]
MAVESTESIPGGSNAGGSNAVESKALEARVVDTGGRQLGSEFSGLDALDLAGRRSGRTRAARLWAGTWPKVLALALVVALWQVVVWSGWRPDYVLPGPRPVFTELGRLSTTSHLWSALGTTMRRALIGFAAAGVIGFLLGVASARIPPLRAAIGSMITALQTMPSIAWFPLAILLFKLSENAIFFVVILGAAPSIANGVMAGVDYVPPLLLRAGRNIGAKGIGLYRFVIAPASLPYIVAGLKQGWAFAWRSLMAGELLVSIANRPSLGFSLEASRQLNDAVGLLAYMIVILILGLLVDNVFGRVDHAVRVRWGITAKR